MDPKPKKRKKEKPREDHPPDYGRIKSREANSKARPN